MLFNSLIFVVFVVITFFLYYLPQYRRWQVPILIGASFIFYAWSSPSLLFLLIFSVLVNTIASFKVINTSNHSQQLFWAGLGVVLNLGILGLFKYAGLLTRLGLSFLNLSAPLPGEPLAFLLTLPLPIGISFYTFQGISLVLDVLHQQEGKQKVFLKKMSPKDYFLNTLFFISFFPQLVAGPIVQAKDFYPQIKNKYFPDINWRIVFNYLVGGYFLKMVVADNLKDFTFWISFPFYQNLGTVTNLVLLFGYSMQIFADFAGYSMIAIGIGAAFGYTLPENFNFPYISRSIAEFWRRWHISLSSWLRNYLYIPLGGNRKGEFRTYLNLMIVMTLGGLWHGAAWSYAVWGIFHGVGLALERFMGIASKPQNEPEKPHFISVLLNSLQVFAVFSFVSLGWLFFKLPNFNEALDFLRSLGNIGIGPRWTYVVPVFIFSLPVVLYHLPHFPKIKTPKHNYEPDVPKSSTWQKLALGIMLFLIILNSGNAHEFIYFQF